MVIGCKNSSGQVRLMLLNIVFRFSILILPVFTLSLIGYSARLALFFFLCPHLLSFGHFYTFLIAVETIYICSSS